MLRLIVTHESLPKAIQLSIEDGNGYDDNAAVLGWQAEVGPEVADVKTAKELVEKQIPGSVARLDAQVALQKLEQSRRPNPESSLMFLIRHVHKFIESILIDQKTAAQQQQQLEEDLRASVVARMTVTEIDSNDLGAS